MKYVTITASSYEEAKRKAENEYGKNVRIHSRRDYSVGGGLFSKKKSRCELTLYLPERSERAQNEKSDEESIKEFEKEAQTPDPTTISLKERLDTEIYRGKFDESAIEKGRRISNALGITGELEKEILSSLTPDLNIPEHYAKRLLSLVRIERNEQIHPKHFLVLLGATGSGKTTSSFKIGSVYKKEGFRVAILSLDYYRVGAFEQSKEFSSALSIPIENVSSEDEFMLMMEKYHYFDLVIVDTMGLSPRDTELNLKLGGMLSTMDRENSHFSLVVSSSTKVEDLMLQYRRYEEFNIDSVTPTKLDETESIGSVLSFSYQTKLPLLFVTNGQKVPEDIAFASTPTILEYLNGLEMNMKRSEGQVRK